MHSEKDVALLHQMFGLSASQSLADMPDAAGITLLRSNNGNEYCFPFMFDSGFVPQVICTLKKANDTHIRYLIHVWKDHALDVPSHDLRRALISLHPENRNALLMLAGENGYAILPLGDTM